MMIDTGKLVTLQGALFFVMGLGIFFRRKIVGEEFQKGLTDLILNLVLPCNIIASFQVELTRELAQRTIAVASLSCFLQLFCWGLTSLLFRRISGKRRPTAKYATMFSNANFFGIPMLEGLLGNNGVILGSVFLLPQRIAMWTVGISFFIKKDRTNAIKKLLATPCFDATVIGLVLLLTQVHLPAVLNRTISILSGCNTGLSIFLIGMLMKDIRLKDFISPEVLGITAVRLIFIPLVMFGFCRLVRAEAMAAVTAVIETAMPVAGMTAILSAKYDADSKFAGNCITVSTFLSLATIPLWCLLLS